MQCSVTEPPRSVTQPAGASLQQLQVPGHTVYQPRVSRAQRDHRLAVRRDLRPASVDHNVHRDVCVAF